MDLNTLGSLFLENYELFLIIIIISSTIYGFIKKGDEIDITDDFHIEPIELNELDLKYQELYLHAISFSMDSSKEEFEKVYKIAINYLNNTEDCYSENIKKVYIEILATTKNLMYNFESDELLFLDDKVNLFEEIIENETNLKKEYLNGIKN